MSDLPKDSIQGRMSGAPRVPQAVRVRVTLDHVVEIYFSSEKSEAALHAAAAQVVKRKLFDRELDLQAEIIP